MDRSTAVEKRTVRSGAVARAGGYRRRAGLRQHQQQHPPNLPVGARSLASLFAGAGPGSGTPHRSAAGRVPGSLA